MTIIFLAFGPLTRLGVLRMALMILFLFDPALSRLGGLAFLDGFTRKEKDIHLQFTQRGFHMSLPSSLFAWQ